MYVALMDTMEGEHRSTQQIPSSTVLTPLTNLMLFAAVLLQKMTSLHTPPPVKASHWDTNLGSFSQLPWSFASWRFTVVKVAYYLFWVTNVGFVKSVLVDFEPGTSCIEYCKTQQKDSSIVLCLWHIIVYVC